MEVAWNNWAQFRFSQLLGCTYIEESQERAKEVGKLFAKDTKDRRLTTQELETMAALVCAGVEAADRKARRPTEVTFEDCFGLTHLLGDVLVAMVDSFPKVKEGEDDVKKKD